MCHYNSYFLLNVLTERHYHSVFQGVVTAVVVVLFMLALFYFYHQRRETGYAEPHVESRTAPPVPSNLVESLTAPPVSSNLVDSAANASSSVGVHLFTHAELEEATDNFHESKVLGDGSFGIVYYGKYYVLLLNLKS